MSKRVLFLYHVPHESGGIFLEEATSFAQVVEKDLSKEKIEESDSSFDLLIVMGGPMNVDETEKYPFLKDEIKLIADYARNKKPVLGVCLGAQLIAKSLGGTVTQNKVKEIGWHDFSMTPHGQNDLFLESVARLKKIFQWHGDTFSLPLGSRHLVQSPLCSYQAFVYQQNIYALQFHLEVTQDMVESWLKVEENLMELKGMPQLSAKNILADTKQYIEAQAAAGRDFIKGYLENVLR